MKPGPPPKPTMLKLLEGNPGKRPLNGNEPKPNPVKRVPPPPKALGKYGTQEWKRIAPELVKLGLLTTLDTTSLYAYCEAYETWREAKGFLSEGGMTYATPTGFLKSSPWMLIAKEALAEMRRWGQELGLTPAARTRIHVRIDDGGESDGEKAFFGY